ncbi:MAG: SDR family oxidoreductase [Deltaproteobacteria bacterium]|jgi:NAD(P)-dependent dehydrogenase (short-subunit alcohol dehydrogenase family)|nr:SDR family oxidoreductase [Deltaproteobacteria bacterium]MBW2536578.1 SDR family oxidoreductase [Deltaproteobacteria bacterium]
MIYFVTGGSRGIGANVVTEAVKLGHDVAFTYVHAEDKAREVADEAKKLRDGAEVRFYHLDVKDAGEVEKVVDQVLDDFDTIDVAVNNAGINRDNVLASMEDAEWDEVIATNLSGPFYVCRQVIPTMMSNRYGRIINVGSVVYGGAAGQANYAASKAGLIGLTKSIAKEYGRKGITANVAVAGFFETDMTRASLPQHMRDFWKTYCPMPKGRVGELHELSAVINFLASKEGAFVNGQVINVTGGLDWGP